MNSKESKEKKWKDRWNGKPIYRRMYYHFVLCSIGVTLWSGAISGKVFDAVSVMSLRIETLVDTKTKLGVANADLSKLKDVLEGVDKIRIPILKIQGLPEVDVNSYKKAVTSAGTSIVEVNEILDRLYRDASTTKKILKIVGFCMSVGTLFWCLQILWACFKLTADYKTNFAGVGVLKRGGYWSCFVIDIVVVIACNIGLCTYIWNPYPWG